MDGSPGGPKSALADRDQFQWDQGDNSGVNLSPPSPRWRNTSNFWFLEVKARFYKLTLVTGKDLIL